VNRLAGATIFLMAAILLLPARPAAAGPFSDTAPSPYVLAIDRLWARDVVCGPGDGTFRPNQSLTRAEASKIVVRAAQELGLAEDLPSPGTCRFPDVPQRFWGRSYIAAAVELGLVRGYEDRTFRPKRSVTRAELAALTVRLGSAAGLRAATDGPSIADLEQVPAWAREYVRQAVGQGSMSLLAGGRFEALRPATRGQAAGAVADIMRRAGLLHDLRCGILNVSTHGLNVSLEGTGERLYLGLPPDAAVYLNGRSTTVGTLAPFVEAAVTLYEGRVRLIEAYFNSETGRVATVDAATDTLMLQLPDGRAKAVALEPTTRIFHNGVGSELGDVRPGDRAVVVHSFFTGRTRVLDAVRPDYTGRLEEVTANGRLLVALSGGGRKLLVPVSSRAILFLDGRAAAPAALRPGDRVLLTVDMGSVVYLEASRFTTPNWP